jgi:hypothetical protein
MQKFVLAIAERLQSLHSPFFHPEKNSLLDLDIN